MKHLSLQIWLKSMKHLAIGFRYLQVMVDYMDYI